MITKGTIEELKKNLKLEKRKEITFNTEENIHEAKEMERKEYLYEERQWW